jgi:hypothetical protein
MKHILLAVNFPSSRDINCNEIMVSAWNNFVKNHKHELLCDTVLVGKDYNPARLAELSPDCNNYTVDNPRSGYLNYNSFVNAEGYDFVIRAHHDAFASVDTINKICHFLTEWSNVDVVVSGNYMKGVSRIEHPVARKIFEEPDGAFKECRPWGMPGHNTDIFAMKRDLFLKVAQKCEDDSRIHAEPFLLTECLSYGEICDILSFSDSRITQEVKDSRVSGGTDFHTYLCAEKPVVAALSSEEGISFKNKNFLSLCANAMKFDKYENVIDRTDECFPHYPIRICGTDHIFHMAGGYLIEFYFKTILKNGEINPLLNIHRAFREDVVSPYYQAHYAIVKLLTERFGSDFLKDSLATSMNRLFAKLNTDTAKLDEYTNRVSAFYSGALKEYL